MDVAEIIKIMKKSGIDERPAEILGFAIKGLHEAGVGSYLMGVYLTHAGATVVNKTLSDSDLMDFADYLKQSADSKIRYGVTRKALSSEQTNDIGPVS